jgi:ABC-type iron transport system FetAB permease component
VGRVHDLITTYACVVIGYVLLTAFHFQNKPLMLLYLFYMIVVPAYVIGSTTLVIYMHQREPKHKANRQDKPQPRSHDPG